MSRIIIEKDKVKLVKEVVEKEVSIDEYYASLTQNASIIIPTLPDCCRGFVSHERYTTFIIEVAPTTQLIRFATGESGRREVFNFEVHMPYVYYGVTVQNDPIVLPGQGTHIVYATKRVNGEDSELGYIATPNCNGERYGTFCTGEISVDDNLPMSQCVNDLVSKMMTSYSNNDYHGVDHDFLRPTIIESRMSEFCDRKAIAPELAKQEKGEAFDERAVHISQYNNRWMRFFYTWEKVSKEMSLEAFVKELKFHDATKSKYKDFINGIAIGLGEMYV